MRAHKNKTPYMYKCILMTTLVLLVFCHTLFDLHGCKLHLFCYSWLSETTFHMHPYMYMYTYIYGVGLKHTGSTKEWGLCRTKKKQWNNNFQL